MRSRDLLDPRPQSVVTASETELLGGLAQDDVRLDVTHVLPRNAYAPSAPHEARDPTDPPRALRPYTRPDENCRDARGLAGAALDLEIVGVPAAPPVPIQNLVVENLQCDIDLGQFWPTFVRIISGIALSATTMMMTR